MPTNSNDLAFIYTAQERTDVSTDDANYVDQKAYNEYTLHQFKNYVGAVNSATLEFKGKSNTAPSVATVYLQIYNINTSTWDTLTSNNVTAANTEFTFYVYVPSFTNYKNVDNVITCRVYQLAPS